MSKLEINRELLPVGWKIKPIGEVCKTGAGGTPLKSNKAYYEGGQIPWLLSGEVAQGEIFKSENYITQVGLENSSAKIFPVNTVLVAMYGATAGQVGILRLEAATNQTVCGILPNKKFIPEFIYSNPK
jgi:type I restriction enzyme S subunit